MKAMVEDPGRFAVGMTATECIAAILALFPQISAIELLEYIVFPHLQERLSTRPPHPGPSLDPRLRHDVRARRFRTVDRPFSLASLEDEHQSLADGAIGFVSRVAVEQTTRHVPMMDFAEQVPFGSALLAAQSLQPPSGHGLLLASGASYHFYGLALLDDREWQEFMGRSLLLSPITDERYIGHRLIDGFGVLRLTASSVKPRVPVLVAHW